MLFLARVLNGWGAGQELLEPQALSTFTTGEPVGETSQHAGGEKKWRSGFQRTSSEPLDPARPEP